MNYWNEIEEEVLMRYINPKLKNYRKFDFIPWLIPENFKTIAEVLDKEPQHCSLFVEVYFREEEYFNQVVNQIREKVEQEQLLYF